MNKSYRLKAMKRGLLLAAAMVMGAVTAWGQWTDPNTGVTFTPVSGSTTGSEGYDKGCDGNTGTKHGGQPNALPHYLVVQASEEVKLTGYTITTANDNQQYTGRSPYTWKIQGSNTNNGSDWVDIASVTNDNTIQNVNYTEYDFSCSTSNYYTYFRFYITAINGGNYMQYSEFHPIGEVRPLEPGTSGGGGSTGPTGVGYVITNGSVYLGGTSTTDIGTFNPKTCLWTGTSGSTWRNSAGYYLRYNNGLTLNASNTSNWTLSGTENGNTGQKINQTNQNNRYIRYNYGWTVSNSTNATNAVFAVTKTTYNASYTVPAIGGATVVSSLGSNNINTIATNAAYTQKYYDYIFRNGAHHYVDDNDETYLTSAPSASTFGYTWSLEGISTDYATINATTGEISYTNSVSSDVVATVKLTASSTKKTFVVTKDVTFKVVPPTSITPSTSSMTVYVGANETVSYALSPTGCYHNVTVSSSNMSVATASSDNNGTVTINPLTTGSTTLTLSAARPDATALTATVNVTVKNKVATPVIAFTPDPNDNTNATATITCATSGYKIYYTKNGGDPTTSSTLYTDAISVVENDVIKAIAVKDPTDANWDNSDIASGTYHACSTMAPVISYAQSGSTATVTITAETGATIYYTTDGNTPTSNSSHGTTTVTISNVSSGATVKAYAQNGDCGASSIVTQEIITSGVSDGTVTLYDYEDHNWTYYSGVDASVDGGNYNTNYVGKLYSPNPRNVKITYNGVNGISGSSTTVKVSVESGETQNQFVYYKTLEQGTTSGEYPYQVISNPFSVRPSTGSGSSKVYYGFAGWKIVSGGEYIKNHSNDDVLDLDEEIVFNNLPYPSVNCTSAEIVFQTTWTTANVQSGNSISMTNLSSSGTYETNFYVLTDASTSTWTGNKNVTVTSVYPDGSSDSRSSSVYTRLNVTVNDGYTVKYEYININDNSTTFSMGSGTKTLYIGRGVSNTNANGVVCNMIRGFNDDITSGGLSYTLKIESGIYNYLCFAKGYDGSGSGNTVTGTIAIKSVLGCDYDRASNTNSNLKIQQQFILGYGTSSGTAMLRSPSAGDEILNVTIKSGSFNSSRTDAGTADASQSFYIGVGNSYCPGYRVLTVEGGELWSIAAGICQNTATTNSIRFRIKGGLIKGSVYGSAANANSYGYKQMIFTGGQVKGWIAGGGNGTGNQGGTTTGSSYVYVGGNCRVDSEGNNTNINSSVGGQVFGSGSGIANTTTWGEMLYGTNVVIADNAYVERNVFGGGNFGWTDEYANIYLTGGNMSVGNVYGGANQNKGENVNIYMTGGTVREGLYGGSNTKGIVSGDVTMKINGGQVGNGADGNGIFGGGYGMLTVINGNINITLGTNGQTTSGVTVNGDVYGGSALGQVNATATLGTSALSNVAYNNGKVTNVTLNKGTINGSLYGGALGNINTAANVYGPVAVKVYGGSVKKTDANGANGSGGVYGANNVNGAPQRSVTVDIYGTDPAPLANEYALYAVYGGGNKANYTYGSGYPKVTVHNCDNSIEYVYGGGNAAAVASTDVKIYGGNKIGTVFGGGNGTVTAANVTGNTSVNIYGGTIGKVFGGSNSQGTIGGTITVNVNKQADTDPEGSSTACDMKIGEVYSGGNMADSKAGSLSIGCTGDIVTGDNGHAAHPENIGTTLEGIGYVYGGANQANIGTSQTASPITLNINSGIVGNVFGGNNTSGTIYGTITVNINKNSSSCGWYVGNVFGGGNLAAYSAPSGSLNYPAVNVLNGTVSGNVYGGGAGTLVDGNDRGQAGKVTGNPQVTIGDNVSGHTAIVLGDVYGGGDAADVAGTPVIVVNDCNTQIGYLYGGGNAADVNGTNITFNAGTVLHDAFGGGHGDKDASNPSKYADVNGSVTFLVKGGTIDRLFAGSNSKGTITTGSTLTVNKTGTCPMKIREVYGGGNEADGKAGTINITCTGALVTEDNGHVAHPENIGTTLEGIGAVYGGANQADIGANGEGNSSNITLNINSGMVGNVYGGNNQSGTIYGDIQVNINKTSDACGWYVGDIFGGGNEADYSGTPDVNIQAGTVYGSVFGGGNAADVGGSDVAISGGQVNGGVYGGCNSSGNTGAVTISLTGGQVGTSGSRADVFGGGFGSATTTSGNIGVTLNGTTVYGDLYGGSALGSVNDADANPANTTTLTISSNTLNGTIYGGGKGSNEGSGTTAISNGNVLINYNTANTSLTGLYGGANVNGNVKGNITVNVNANVGTDANHTINVFGGGLGHATGTEGNVTVNVGTASVANAPTIYGDIYGGSALGNVNNAVEDLTTVNILNGTVHGNVYGGGLGAATLNANNYIASVITEAIVNGTVHVNIGDASNTNSTPTIDGKVFGCNNLAGTPKGHVYVDVYRTAHTAANTYPSPEPASAGAIPTPAATEFAIQEVYGGGNLAHYTTTLSGASTHVHIHNCDNTIRYVYGGGNAANTVANEVTIDGGRMEYVFGGGNGAGTGNPGANVEGNAKVNLYGGIINYVFGGSNTKGVVNGTASMTFDRPNGTPVCTRLVKELYGGGNEAPGGSVNLTIPCGVTGLDVVYGGSKNADIGTQALFNAGTKKNVILTIEGGNLAKVFGGNNQGGIIYGDVTLNLKGGTIVDAFGGNNAGGNIKGSITVNVEEDESLACPLVLTNVFGGGKDAAYTPADATISYPQVNINHKKSGTSITGSVFGGGQGSGAVVTANPVVTIGDNNASHLATIAGNVYGGGDAAAVTGNTTVTYNDNNTSSTVAKLFGGGNAAGVSGTATVTLTSGKVTSGLYGGCNTSGAVGGAITVNVTGGTVGTNDAISYDGVFGGGYGSSTSTGDAITVTIGDGTTSPVIYGDVYGGSALGNVNDAVTELTKVWLKSGTVNGNLYGGGLGQAAVAAVGTEGQPGYVPAVPAYAALVNGKVQVVVDGGSVTGAVFGCNNINGTPKGTVEVEINSTAATDRSGATPVYALQAVYGGGNLAHYDPTTPGNYPTVTVNGCNTSIKDVFGGGNAAAVPYTHVTINGGDIYRVFAGGNGESGTAANVGYKNSADNPTSDSYGTGTANATIKGGTIYQVFGGSNSKGTVRASGTLSIDKPTSGSNLCDMKVAEVYGGGNLAAGAASAISIGCTGAIVPGENGHAAHPENIGTTLEGIGAVYGGANQAGISGNILLTIEDGIIRNVFGGNNQSGTISGTITVNINQKATPCGWYVYDVYGGGNEAPYGTAGSNYPRVNLLNGTVSHNVFGGGLGSTATVTGNPVVYLQGGTVSGKVFGGGSAAPVTGNPTVNVLYGSAPVVHGGGLGSTAAVTGNPSVVVNETSGETLTVTSVFGGGDAAPVTGATTVTLTAGTLTNAFGGGNVADVTGTTSVTLQGATVANIYGGGNEADVSGTTTVTLTSGTATAGIYGGCNTEGTVGGNITVALNGGTVGVNGTTTDVVYGGGYGHNTATGGDIIVTLNGSTVYGNLYGGSALGSVNGSSSNTTTVTLSSNGLHGTVFGGGMGSGSGSATQATTLGNVLINYNTANTSLTGFYGGANVNGNVKGNIEVNVLAGVGTSGSRVDVFGGGLGAATQTEGNVTVNIGNQAGTSTPDIYGDVYGGSSLGSVNNEATDKTTVNILSGSITGNVYGGGMGEAGVANVAKGQVNGEIVVNIGKKDGNNYYGSASFNTYTVSSETRGGSVYGCNNTNGSPKADVTVNVYQTAHTLTDAASYHETGATYAIDQVFGGGNLADYSPASGKKTTVNVVGCSNTVRRVFGGGNAAAALGVVTVIDGGRFDYIFGGGNGEVSAANIGNGGVSLTVSAGRINHLFGGSNTQGTIGGTTTVDVNYDNYGTSGCEEVIDEFFGGGNLADITGDLNTTIACGTQFGAVYGGCNLADITGDVTLTIEGGVIGSVYGGSKGRIGNTADDAANITGNVTLNIYGGEIGSAFGGSNINGEITGSIEVNVDWSQSTCSEKSLGYVYGASDLATYTPTTPGSYPEVNIKHCTVSHSVFGGGNGDPNDATKGVVTSNPVVTIGDNVAGHSAIVTENVYGGGNNAAVTGYTTVTYNDNNASSTVANLFGGGNAAGVSGTATVTLTSGKVTAGIYGGCNASGTVGGAIAVNVTGGTVGTDATHTANVHGGGYGPSTGTGNNVEVTIGPSGAGTGPTIYGDVYGGSALGNVNGTSANTTYHTYVTLNKGTINGNLYGGGLGQTSPTAIAAMVYSPVQVTVNSGTVTGAVYGCNNSNGAPQSTVNVDIYGTDQPATGYAIGKVFGGGNQAAYGSTPVVKVHNCDNKIEYVYGGGNAATVQGTDVTIYGGNTIGNVYGGCYGADVTTNGTDVKIYGGTIGKVFGGNNSSGTVTGSINVNVNKQTEAGHSACEMHITEVYGGGNLAASAAGNVEIGCTGGATEGIDYVYGGANQANVTGDITLSITGGRINNVFGGNNTSGTISGDITVDVEWDGSCAQNYLGNVYGAGNLAPYTMHSTGPTVNIKNGTAANVYGGGKGATAIVTGDPVVTIGDNVAEHCAIVSTNVYGGGDAAAVTGNTSVTYNDNHASSTVGKLFGGGNAASVSGTSTVTLTSGNVTGGVYGGCNSSGSVGAVTVALNGGQVGASGDGNSANVYGGGFGPSTTTSDNIDVTLNGTTVYGDLYGGSALGSVNAANKTTTVTISSNTLHGTIYGGGQGSNEGTGTTATTLGNVVINYNTANSGLTGLYGGANVNGDVAGNINVNIEDNVGASGAGNSVDIFGGGLGQNTTTGGNVTVTVGNGSTPVIYGDIYGGSGYGEVGATGMLAKVDFKAGTLNGTLYGGGMGQGSPAISATVTGGTEVDVTAGTVSGGIYGGCNERGTVVEDITVNVTGGTIGADGSPASVYGGGYGNNTATQGNVTVTLNGASATVWGDIYGGSGFGNVNDASSDATTVNILNGTVMGNVFGGGLGQKSPNNYSATEYGAVTVNIGSDNGDGTYSGNATIGGSVYGCNNTNGSPQDTVVVNIYQTAHISGTNTVADNGYAIASVFGGGKNADYTGSKRATVNVFTCDNTIGDLYGGGDAAAVTGSKVVINGGRFGRVFGGGNGAGVGNPGANIGALGITLALHGGNIGTLVSGSNERGTISGPIKVTVDNASGCNEEVTDFFGGSNAVDISTDVTTTIDCGAGTFRNVYGGSNAADITGNVVLNIKGGTMTNVFGGSKGVADNPSTPADEGVAADITGNVTLNLYGGTMVNAFGGSDQNGNITGNIAVNVLDHEGDCKLDVTNIYGAGNVTPYTPTSNTATSPVVNVMHIKVSDAVADDPTTTDVDESRPAIPGIRGSVFGGGLGNTAVVTAYPQVNIGYTSSMSALPTVQYPAGIASSSYTAIVCGSLYGGGDAAAVTGNPVVTVNNSSSMVKERIIGGGNAANVTGSTHVVINDGVFGTGTGASRGVYGGCNTTGTVSGNAVVDVLGGTFGTQADVNNRISYNIHGGGFGQSTLVSGNVTVNYGADDGTTSTASAYPKLYGDIYGGSALGDVNTDGSNTTTVNVLNGSFGHFDDMIGGEIVNGERVGGYLNQHGGNIYGGGLGQKHADVVPAHGNPGDDDYTPAIPEVPLVEAKVYGVVTVNIGAGPESDPTGLANLALCNVYGCNNAAGSPQENVFVKVYQTAHTTKNTASYIPGLDDKVTELFAIRNVYGGGNAADFAPTVNPSSKKVSTHIYTCLNTVENVYGGGNAAAVTATDVWVEGGRYNFIFAGGNGQITAANVLGHAEMTIRSGRVGWYFEGCNMQGTVGSVNVTAGHAVGDPTWPCGELVVDNYYFGSNMATVVGGKVSVVNCGDQFEYRNVYAGSRLATIYGDIQLTVRGGVIGNLYGGSEGSDFISANVKKYPESYADIDNFPEGDRAVLREYFANNAHDGEYGTGGNITLVLEGGDIKNVFGGCNYRGLVEGDIHIIVDSNQSCSLDIDYLYGGSRLSAYSPDGTATTSASRISPLVELRRGHVNFDVFGGSRGGDPSHPWGNGVVYSNPKVIVGDGVAGHTFRIGHVDNTTDPPTILGGDLFGGGSAGDVHGNVEVIIKGTTDAQGHSSTDIKNNVFGGGKSGDVYGNTKVTIVPQP